MKTKLGLAALIAAAAMITMPVNSAEAGFHGWHKRHCMFKWTHCYCKRKAVKKYYKKKWVKKARKGKKGGKAK